MAHDSRFPIKLPKPAHSGEVALLAGARRLLKMEGKTPLTMHRLAAVSGSSVASVTKYYPNREAVFAALLEDHQADVLRTLERDVVPTIGTGSLAQDMGRVLAVILRKLTEEASVLSVVFTEGQDDLGRGLLITFKDQVDAAVRYAFRKSPAPIRMRDVELAALIVTRAALTATYNVITGKVKSEEKPLIEHAINMFDRFVA